MSLDQIIAIAGLGLTVLGCTYHLSSKIERISGIALQNKADIASHEADDKETHRAIHARIDELFRWVGFFGRRSLQPISSVEDLRT